MKRLSITFALAGVLLASVVGPVAAAGPSTPSSSLTGGCSTLTYSWSNFRKARTAEFRIHHFGIYEATRSTTPVGASGTFAMPSTIAFVGGDQYTVMAILLDASGRAIQPSPAVWWGTC